MHSGRFGLSVQVRPEEPVGRAPKTPHPGWAGIGSRPACLPSREAESPRGPGSSYGATQTRVCSSSLHATETSGCQAGCAVSKRGDSCKLSSLQRRTRSCAERQAPGWTPGAGAAHHLQQRRGGGEGGLPSLWDPCIADHVASLTNTVNRTDFTGHQNAVSCKCSEMHMLSSSICGILETGDLPDLQDGLRF